MLGLPIGERVGREKRQADRTDQEDFSLLTPDTVPNLTFRRESSRSSSPHLYAVYRPDSDADWLDQLADAYVRLRATCRSGLPESVLDGIDVVDRATVERYLTRAVVPRATSLGPLDIVRADLGEMLGYELLEGVFGTRIAYKLVRDRETVKLPGRGIDAIGAEDDADPTVTGDAAREEIPTLVLAEVKVSDEAASPPQVVDRKRDSMRNQHRAHIKERRATTDKVWLAVRNAMDTDTSERLTRIALRLERGMDGLSIVACCVLVRPAIRVSATDCGTFSSKPSDFAPARIRFLTVSLPADMPATLAEWDAAIERAIGRQCGGNGGAVA